MSETTAASQADTVVDRTGATQATQGTDLHKSKISPDDPRLHVDRPRARMLRRGPAIIAVLSLGGVIAIALIVALVGSSGDQAAANKAQRAPEISTAADRHPANQQTAAQSIDQRAEALRQMRQEELLRARGATVFAGVDDAPGGNPSAQAEPPRRSDAGREGECTGAACARSGGTPGSSPPPDPNLQERKNDFLARAGVSGAEYLEKGVSYPRSPYEIKAGSVIPTVLISGINSDLPGQVVAQVRENVYDTVTGNHLLVPQGSRLLAAYDSMVAWGQERVLVCWNRLIRPDGSSITLDCMPGVDLAGYSGFADGVDNHWWKIIGGAVFSSVLAATAQRSQGDVTGFQPTFPQVWANNAAGQINQSGQQITQKNLQLQPTITVRPGFSVNVLVTKDIVIAPFSPQGGTP